jgi:hypothetical protein
LFIGGLFEPLSSFRGASFLVGGLFEPMSEGFHSAPLLMASLLSANVLVEYKANLLSYFDLEFS